MKLYLLICLNGLFCFSGLAQNKICVAFYNQENLFDTLHQENKKDIDFTPEGMYKWNSEKYHNKIQNMAKVILAMNERNGPDFLGMAEVENNNSLSDLLKELQKNKQSYEKIWFDSPDERGIDNALLFKKNLVKSHSSHLYLIDTAGIGNDQTRGILLGSFILKNKSKLHVLVNHWPSRREGEKESEFKRIFVASVLRKICDSIQQTDPLASILLMGDFNDYPNNRSLVEVLGAKSNPSTLSKNQFYNPMYALMESGLGSYKYQGQWNFLDQILLSENLLGSNTKLTYLQGSAAAFKEDWMLETEEKYKGSPKRTFGGKKYLNGYSDHLPVYLYLSYP